MLGSFLNISNPFILIFLLATKYKVSFKLANVKYVDGLTSYDSGVYQNYAGKIEKAVRNLVFSLSRERKFTNWTQERSLS